MKLVITLLLLVPAVAFSQYRITVIVDKVPADTKDRLYLAGNFNNWEPADENNALSKDSEGKFTKVFEDIPAGEYEYKFTQGSNESIEVGKDGKDIANRVLSLRSDTTIHLTIAAWKNAKTASLENSSTWSNLKQPFYNLITRERKQVGVISRSRLTLQKS